MSEKIPTNAAPPKIAQNPAGALPSVVVVVVVSSVVVTGGVVEAELICILESDFRVACHEKVWRMKSIPCSLQFETLPKQTERFSTLFDF